MKSEEIKIYTQYMDSLLQIFWRNLTDELHVGFGELWQHGLDNGFVLIRNKAHILVASPMSLWLLW